MPSTAGEATVIAKARLAVAPAKRIAAAANAAMSSLRILDLPKVLDGIRRPGMA
jgi:hypothetical protein